MNPWNQMVITGIEDMTTVPQEKGNQVAIRDRRCWGLSFCQEGQITYRMGGREYVSTPDCAVLLPCGQSYTLVCDKTGIFPVINFQCLEPIGDTVQVFPIENPDWYLKEYEQMKALFLFERNRAKVLGLFYQMIHRLSAIGTQESGVLAPAIRYLEEQYQNPDLTNAALARICGISEVYFRKLFAQQCHTTPRQFVIDVRMDKAKQLLTDGILKIGAVAEACGFSNPYHFCRAFKKRVGITPTQYMKENKIHKI